MNFFQRKKTLAYIVVRSPPMKKLFITLALLSSFQIYASEIKFQRLQCSIYPNYFVDYYPTTRKIEVADVSGGAIGDFMAFKVLSEKREKGTLKLNLGQYGNIQINLGPAGGWSQGVWQHHSKLNAFLQDAYHENGSVEINECVYR